MPIVADAGGSCRRRATAAKFRRREHRRPSHDGESRSARPRARRPRAGRRSARRGAATGRTILAAARTVVRDVDRPQRPRGPRRDTGGRRGSLLGNGHVRSLPRSRCRTPSFGRRRCPELKVGSRRRSPDRSGRAPGAPGERQWPPDAAVAAAARRFRGGASGSSGSAAVVVVVGDRRVRDPRAVRRRSRPASALDLASACQVDGAKTYPAIAATCMLLFVRERDARQRVALAAGEARPRHRPRQGGATLTGGQSQEHVNDRRRVCDMAQSQNDARRRGAARARLQGAGAARRRRRRLPQTLVRRPRTASCSTTLPAAKVLRPGDVILDGRRPQDRRSPTTSSKIVERARAGDDGRARASCATASRRRCRCRSSQVPSGTRSSA